MLGIRGSLNLSWKLRRIIRGQSSVDLLETCESERGSRITVFVEVAHAPHNRTRRRRSGASRYAPRSGPAPSRWRPLGGTPSVQDAVGSEFVLVGDPSTLDDAARSAAPQWEKPTVQVVRYSENGASEWLEKLDAKAVLVRAGSLHLRHGEDTRPRSRR